ncbi:acyl carrier protein [Heterostelium album PN500]|uniref:Acyl carrier protein n=1 Tax=Heterostelium pallidum (strain ATCC 26659 / Pp 5 / PN500) TaxID=670386 RepID=D3AVK7_HETP5|nr:acyl carrier protein [Heterostelium album PN500]EFA86330.1 acyl carrier protein [Heterostelium album PN500]|eukprot:XP_020438435.1 acyl carrier protein [Heterostelium album PN500]
MLSRSFKSLVQIQRPVLMAGQSSMIRSFSSDHRLSEKEVTDRILEVISKYDKCAGKSVSPSDTFKELELDSLDSADILVAVEEEFGIEIPDEEVDRITSVKDTISYIRKTPTAK